MKKSYTFFQFTKNALIETCKVIGALLLLFVLLKGIFSFLTYLEPSKFWIAETEDGKTDRRNLICLVVGVPLWMWIIYSVKRSRMTDEEKDYSDSQARLPSTDDEF